MPSDRLRALPGQLFTALCAAMFGLAAGALWTLPSMFYGRALPLLALPVGWILGVIVRRWLKAQGGYGALLAAAATLLASLYTTCLVAAAMIAGLMGVGFADALRDAGPKMLLELARLSIGPRELAFHLAGAALAALAAWPLRRRSPSSP
ncbi:vitamin B12 transport system permease protein [Luteibacter rhizovicinus]|uniref:Vitamin B12 transport system permease protein n=1 Tax=Luteibacter rhizovicinus TaxID=242606 RepID=A0A4R3YGJ9_9GAMM|nr:hypothetical protein [Luteibacter rhizovicinus]TCV91280.1 vitamin B12 transport system permease protein [Luteibacter rhizovicinus]